MEIKKNKIQVNLNEFLNRFIYFRDKNITNTDLQNAYINAGNYIATTLNTINLPKEQQINGVYLALAHNLYLKLNPNLLGGMVNSTNQGSESVGFQQKPIKNWLEYYLGLTIYGLELLSILQIVQPPLIKKPLNLYPYYNNINTGFYGY